MTMLLRSVMLCAAAVGLVNAHGHLTWPPSTRHGGSLEKGGLCTNGACYWFTNNVEINVTESLPVSARSMKVKAGVKDVYKTSPWRAPGTAQTLGQGCGVNGGGPTIFANGGIPQAPIKQGIDGYLLPKQKPVVWKIGSIQDVAWALSANHGGGYTYRLCKDDGEGVTEECFQANTLQFATNSHWIWYPNGTKIEIPMTKITTGTYPVGSEWARDPIPGCYQCDPYDECGAPINPPIPGYPKSNPWNDQVNCYGACAGAKSSKTLTEGFCPGDTQFPAPSRYTGFGKYLWEWSIMDKVIIPSSMGPGNYLLSWRWDCEESTQVWQNCADVVLANSTAEVAAAQKIADDFRPVPIINMSHIIGSNLYKEKAANDKCSAYAEGECRTDGKALGCIWFAPKKICYTNKDKTAGTKTKCDAAPDEATCTKNTACTWYSAKGKTLCYDANAKKTATVTAGVPTTDLCVKFTSMANCGSMAPICKWDSPKTVCYDTRMVDKDGAWGGWEDVKKAREAAGGLNATTLATTTSVSAGGVPAAGRTTTLSLASLVGAVGLALAASL